MTITAHVTQFVTMKQKLGYRFTTNAKVLTSFARFAAEEEFIHSGTVLAWASAASSQPWCVKRLHIVHAFALWMHAEDARHEVPPRDAFGPLSHRRPAPYLVSIPDIRKLLSAAHSMPPAGTINPLTWHYLFGLIAATGLRIGEALALTLDDITPDGLIIRDSKFRKSRMVAMHPTTREALNRYLAVRCKASTPDEHLFVLATGRPPNSRQAGTAFRKLTEQTEIRKPGTARGPTPHSLRHSFALRSLEDMEPGTDPSRHMLALATHLGHVDVSGTYWYLEATPVLLHGIAEAAERRHHAMKSGGSRD